MTVLAAAGGFPRGPLGAVRHVRGGNRAEPTSVSPQPASPVRLDLPGGPAAGRGVTHATDARTSQSAPRAVRSPAARATPRLLPLRDWCTAANTDANGSREYCRATGHSACDRRCTCSREAACHILVPPWDPLLPLCCRVLSSLRAPAVPPALEWFVRIGTFPGRSCTRFCKLAWELCPLRRI